MLIAAVLCSVSAHAKKLSVSCESTTGQSINMVSEIANVNKAQKIQSLSINENEVLKFRDVSKMPIYKNGDISLQIQFGKNLFSSAEITLSHCNDDFEATGKAVIHDFIGGFAGTRLFYLDCTCSLK